MMFLGTNVRDSRRIEALAGYCVPAKTGTGVWSVAYNAENRPIRWQSGDTVITMAFDRMGRRVEMRTVKDGAETLQRFVYDNYLCIQQLRGADNALFHSYVWDPTEPIATRPLIFIPSGGEVSYYFHDGNKNVSDLIPTSGTPTHYAYTPFGTPTASAPSENPYTFSSEANDDTIGLVYYNYRHYNPAISRWCGRDIIFQLNPYTYQGGPSHYDMLGLAGCCTVCVYSAINIDTARNNLTGPLQNPGEFGGHTWFTIENSMNEESAPREPTKEDLITFSFGPREPSSTKELCWGTPGGNWPVDGYSNEKQYVMAKRCWSADRETCCNLKQDVNEFNKNPEEFSAFNYCTSKTVELLRRHNIDVPDGEGEIEIPYFFNISAPNPRDMYNQLNSLPDTLQQQCGTNETGGKKNNTGGLK